MPENETNPFVEKWKTEQNYSLLAEKPVTMPIPHYSYPILLLMQTL